VFRAFPASEYHRVMQASTFATCITVHEGASGAESEPATAPTVAPRLLRFWRVAKKPGPCELTQAGADVLVPAATVHSVVGNPRRPAVSAGKAIHCDLF